MRVLFYGIICCACVAIFAGIFYLRKDHRELELARFKLKGDIILLKDVSFSQGNAIGVISKFTTQSKPKVEILNKKDGDIVMELTEGGTFLDKINNCHPVAIVYAGGNRDMKVDASCMKGNEFTLVIMKSPIQSK